MQKSSLLEQGKKVSCLSRVVCLFGGGGGCFQTRLAGLKGGGKEHLKETNVGLTISSQ